MGEDPIDGKALPLFEKTIYNHVGITQNLHEPDSNHRVAHPGAHPRQSEQVTVSVGVHGPDVRLLRS